MSANLTVRYLNESDYPAWNELVAASPEGSVYSTPEYLDVLCSATDARFRILGVERSGELVGGIGLYERTARWGEYVNGRLLLYYNGFVLKPHSSKYPSERTSKQLEALSALEQAISSNGYGRVRIKSRSTIGDVRIFQNRGWRVEPSYTYVVPLGDTETLWGRMEQNLRRLVKRCTSEGIQFTADDDFKSFYRLHQQTHERKGAALYLSELAFQKYFEKLRAQQLCQLFHARTPDGRVISTQLVLLGSHPTCHTVSAAADAEFLKTGATAFLRWRTFEHLSKLGYRGNDLTDAELNPVTHFKSQLGGDLVMNLTLALSDRRGFKFESLVYQTGSAVKRAGRTIVKTLSRSGKES